MTFEAQLATILKTTEKNAIARAAGLRVLSVCDRCGGSGHYSYNQISGTTCFKCAGLGQVKPTKRQQKEVLIDAQAAVNDGRLEVYLADRDMAAKVKNALSATMKLWKDTGISSAYDWRSAYVSSQTFTQRDYDIAVINSKMAAAYSRVQEAVANTSCKDNMKKREAIRVLAQVFDQALADIAAADIELKKYLEKNA